MSTISAMDDLSKKGSYIMKNIFQSNIRNGRFDIKMFDSHGAGV